MVKGSTLPLTKALPPKPVGVCGTAAHAYGGVFGPGRQLPFARIWRGGISPIGLISLIGAIGPIGAIGLISLMGAIGSAVKCSYNG